MDGDLRPCLHHIVYRGIRITPGKVLRSALRSVLDSSPKLVLRISLRWMAPRNDFDGGSKVDDSKE